MLLRLGAFWVGMVGCILSCHAQQTYHVSPTGDDALSGLSPTNAWQSLDALNAQTFLPGDSILFERGGIWHGMLHLKGSGMKERHSSLEPMETTPSPGPFWTGTDTKRPF